MVDQPRGELAVDVDKIREERDRRRDRLARLARLVENSPDQMWSPARIVEHDHTTGFVEALEWVLSLEDEGHTFTVTERELRAILSAFDVARDQTVHASWRWYTDTKYVDRLYLRLRDAGRS